MTRVPPALRSVLAAALAATIVLASMGPAADTDTLYDTPWSRGRRLVDSKGVPYAAQDIEPKTFYTAYPEGASHDLVGSPLVVVRLDPAELHLPRDRAGWAPEGILAYSKICTHAGCAIALYSLVMLVYEGTFSPVQAAVLCGVGGAQLAESRRLRP